MDKQTLRAQMINKRASISKEDLISNSKIITDKVLSSKEYNNADTLLIYVGIKGEVLTAEIIENALIDKKKVAAPRIDLNSDIMNFYEIRSSGCLEKASFGLLEPKDYCPLTENCEHTLMIAPGVAFDKEKNRLGYGKGYYDTYLNTHNHKYLDIIALSHDFQILDGIPHNKYDAKMDKIITEKRIIR